MDKVSVIIPNHNKAAFLKASLNSVQHQTFQNWEAIVVDDGSTDGSIALIEAFTRADDRFRLISLPKQKNGGSVCRNRGLAEAKGMYVVFFDSDDVLAPFCLERRVKAMNENPGLDFAVFPMQPFKQEPGDHVFIWQPEKEKAFERFLMHDLPWQTMQPIYKAEFLKGKFEFNESLGRHQDVHFHLSILRENPKFEAVETVPDCYYRVEQSRQMFKPVDFFNMKIEALTTIKEDFCHDRRDFRFHAVSLLYCLSDLNQARLNKRISRTEAGQLANKLLDEATEKSYMLKLYQGIAFGAPLRIPGLRRAVKQLILR